MAVQSVTLGAWPRESDDRDATLPIFGGIDMRSDWASGNMEAARENSILKAVDTVKNIKSGKGIVDGVKSGINKFRKGKGPQTGIVSEDASSVTSSVDEAVDGSRSVDKELLESGKGEFSATVNSQGGNVYQSDGPITQDDFVDIVDGSDNKVDILTGIHGDADGGISTDRSLFEQDSNLWNDNPNVEVHDVNGMTEDSVQEILNSDSDTVCAWCFSDRTDAIDGMIKE
jgi:hypothetical protein